MFIQLFEVVVVCHKLIIHCSCYNLINITWRTIIGPSIPGTTNSPENHIPAPTELLVASTQDRLLALPNLESKDPEVFQWEAHDFFHAQKDLLEDAMHKSHPQPAVYARVELMKRYVNDAEFRELGELCNLLILFPIFAAEQQRHQELFTQLRSLDKTADRLEEEEIRNIRDEMYRIRDNLIGFNHMLRDFLIENGSYVGKLELEDWFTKMNRNVPGPAKAIIRGVAAEAAVIRFIQQHGEEHGLRVRPATTEEDRKGIDMVVVRDGRIKMIDVKTGGQMSFGITGNEEVNVDARQMKNFDLDPDGQRDILGQLLAS